MTADQRIMAWVTEADMFICETWPWLLAILILFVSWVCAMIWIDHRQ